MNRQDNLRVLEEIFSTVLDRDVALKEEYGVLDVEGWDSLTHLLLVSLIEEKYQVKFALGEQQEMQNISTILDLIAEKVEK